MKYLQDRASAIIPKEDFEKLLNTKKEPKIENKKFLLVDDLLATGGTANAAVKLIEKAGGNVSCFGSLIELSFLNGRDKLSIPVQTLIKY